MTVKIVKALSIFITELPTVFENNIPNEFSAVMFHRNCVVSDFHLLVDAI